MRATSSRRSGPASRPLRHNSSTLRRSAHILSVIIRHCPSLVRNERSTDALGAEVRSMLCELGPTFTKLGQLIASTPGLFSDTFSDACRELLDQVPPVSYEQVEAVFHSDLGRMPIDCFATFETTPLAAGSIAQVHAARLLDGTDVVVKIQRPDVREIMDVDLRIVRRLARLVERLSSRAKAMNPVKLVDDLSASIEVELNFRCESRSMTEYRMLLAHSDFGDHLRVPHVYPSFSGSRVITMDRVRGSAIDKVVDCGRNGPDRFTLLRSAVGAWLQLATSDGIFHGDLHAGNLMVDTDGKLAILDFGITGRLDPRVREMIRQAVPLVVLQGDFRGLASILCELADPVCMERCSAVAADLAEVLAPARSQTFSELRYGQILSGLLETATRHEITLPQQLVLVVKQLLYFERYAKLLAPDWTLLSDAELVSALVSHDPQSFVGSTAA